MNVNVEETLVLGRSGTPRCSDLPRLVFQECYPGVMIVLRSYVGTFDEPSNHQDPFQLA